MSECKFMTREQIMDTIRDLSRSQGLYARILQVILTTQENEPETHEQYMNHLVNQQFSDPVDLVLFFES